MNVLTLDEAIKHCEEVAENQEWLTESYDDDSMGAKLCKECAEEHRQLAEWLERLKAFEEAYEEIKSFPLVWEEGQGIQKCIGLIEKKLKGVNG